VTATTSLMPPLAAPHRPDRDDPRGATTELRLGRATCGALDVASEYEWLVADGVGGYAMGTVSGLRTRRYHGLLVVATAPPIGRHLGLAALDAVLVLGDRRHHLASHEWADGTVDPEGSVHLESFRLRDGLPVWRWSVGPVVVEAELAMLRGRAAVGMTHRVVRADRPVRLEVQALCTWRDVHGERRAYGEPAVQRTADGFVFEDRYRVRGPGYEPAGVWWRGVRYREEAARGLTADEDVWHAGTFGADLQPGQHLEIEAWAGPLDEPPPSARRIVTEARARVRSVVARAQARDDAEAHLAVAADQLVVAGPTVVAGYPWFGDWSRDTMTSYEGLFLETGRADEGRALLLAAGQTVSEGMLANTADVGGTEYNTVDAAMWFMHATLRHADLTGDLDLAAELAPALRSVVAHHVAGTRFGIRVDDDGLVTQGADGWALTWMDARVDGRPITARVGKPVEVNALWVSGLTRLARLEERLRLDGSRTRALERRARDAFVRRFPVGGPSLGLHDVVDGPGGDDRSVRPNQLLAVSLPEAPITDAGVVRACAPLLTSLGLRSLDPRDPAFRGRHRGNPAERDRAYHEGTVWPWLIGPYVEAARRTGVDVSGVLDGLVAHLGEWGLGSVSETADGDAPHAATGCPFQAWSVAEVLRALRLAR
jgi:predicted glycogen debranching enzyme